MGNIVAFTGKKQSGKNTCANWIMGLKMCELDITHGISLTKHGYLYITDLWNDTSFAMIIDYYNQDAKNKEFFREKVEPWMKPYSFADLLKSEVCMGLLGLSWEQCYGSDADKNSYTHIHWENMPGVVVEDEFVHAIMETAAVIKGRLGDYYSKVDTMVYHERGPMTARQVMQYVGTDIFRRMYGDVWAKGTVNRIIEEDSELAVITDCRFPNEVKAVQEAGGKVIRLLRHAKKPDTHESEMALDDHKGFDLVIDNRKLTAMETNAIIYDKLVEWGIPMIKRELLTSFV